VATTKFVIPAAVKAAIFSYIEAGITSAVLIALSGGAQHPADLLWAFLAGALGPIVKWLNPLDASLGIGKINLPDAPTGNPVQTAVAEAVAASVTGQVESAVSPALDTAVAAAAPVVAPVVDAVTPVVEAVVNAAESAK
jgi:hypothetical protein